MLEGYVLTFFEHPTANSEDNKWQFRRAGPKSQRVYYILRIPQDDLGSNVDVYIYIFIYLHTILDPTIPVAHKHETSFHVWLILLHFVSPSCQYMPTCVCINVQLYVYMPTINSRSRGPILFIQVATAFHVLTRQCTQGFPKLSFPSPKYHILSTWIRTYRVIKDIQGRKKALRALLGFAEFPSKVGIRSWYM